MQNTFSVFCCELVLKHKYDIHVSILTVIHLYTQDSRDLEEQPDIKPVHLHISAGRLPGVQNRSVKRGELHLGHIWTVIIQEQWRELHIHGKEEPELCNGV